MRHLCQAILLAAAVLPVGAATLTWDTASTSGYQAGSGTWEGVNWSSNGTTLASWTLGSTAAFLGETSAVNNTITIGTAQTFSGLIFGSGSTSGNWTLTGAEIALVANSTITVNPGSTAQIADVISGTGFVLTKNGSGLLTLTGANTYTGGTTISAGTLKVASGGSLGPGGVTVSTGAKLMFEASNSTIAGLYGNGEVALDVGSVLTVGLASGTAKFYGFLSGQGGFVKSGPGQLEFNGDSTGYTGAVTLAGGVLIANNTTNSFGSGLITVTSNSTIGSMGTNNSTARITGVVKNDIFVPAGVVLTLGTAFGQVNLMGKVEATTIVIGATTSGSPAVSIGNDFIVSSGSIIVGSGSTLRVGGGTGGLGAIKKSAGATTQNLDIVATGSVIFDRVDAIVYSGIISGIGSLTQDGLGGELVITGANTYTGGTTVSRGTLRLTSAGSLGTGNITVATGAKLVYEQSATNPKFLGGGEVWVQTGNTLTFNVGSGASIKYSNQFRGASSWLKSGLGDLYLSGDSTGFTGAVTLADGNIVTNNLTSSLGEGVLTVIKDAMIGAEGLNFSTRLEGRVKNRIRADAGVKLTFGRANGTTYLAGAVEAENVNIGIVGGSQTMWVYLENDLVVSGALLVADGDRLYVGNGGTTGAIMRTTSSTSQDLNVDLSGASSQLYFNRSDSVTYSGVISNSGSVVKTGNGTVTLTSVNTYTGTTTISAGTLTVAPGGSLGTGSVILDGGKLVMESLDVSRISAAKAGEIDAVLTGFGGLTKSGTGRLVLSGQNTYLGVTNVTAGTLVVNGAVKGVTVASLATLGGKGVVGDVVLFSGATLAPGDGLGMLTMSSLDLRGGAKIAWQMKDPGLAAGIGYDTTKVAGPLDLRNASSANKIQVRLSSVAGSTFDARLRQSFILISYDGLSLGSGVSVSDLFSFDTSDGFYDKDGVAVPAESFQVYNDTESKAIMLSYVPEPSSYGFGVGGLALAAAAIRRRRRSRDLSRGP